MPPRLLQPDHDEKSVLRYRPILMNSNGFDLLIIINKAITITNMRPSPQLERKGTVLFNPTSIDAPNTIGLTLPGKPVFELLLASPITVGLHLWCTVILMIEACRFPEKR